MQAIVKDSVVLTEEGFYEPRLLETEYFKKNREGYYAARQYGLLNPHRNYLRFINLFSEINEFNKEHARIIRSACGKYRPIGMAAKRSSPR